MFNHDISREPTWVYRCTCQHDALLYVGVALDIDRRLAQHSATKEWWTEVTFIDVERFPTRYIALKIEAFYIAYEQPKYNVQGIRPIPDRPNDPIGRRHYLLKPTGLELEAVSGQCD